MTKLINLMLFAALSVLVVIPNGASSFVLSPQIPTSGATPLWEDASRKSKGIRPFYSAPNDLDTKDSAFPILNRRATGILVLMTVPLAWGTYTPAVKYLYELRPAVPGFVFSAAYYVVASLILVGLVAWKEHDAAIGHDDAVIELPIRGGFELGLYLFIGNAFQVIGLKTIPSDRAGFLVQLTTVMVPVVQAIVDRVGIPLKVGLACLVAFTGVVVMGLDGKDMGNSFSAIATGDLMIIGAAFFYTLHVVRLSRYVQDSTPLKLAATKALAEAFLSLTLVVIFLGFGNVDDNVPNGAIIAARDAGMEISSFFSELQLGFSSGILTASSLAPAIGAVLWTGFITCAYTIYAQSFGQSRVSATEANLIYTAQPLFTSLFAFLLLGETLGPAGLLGATLIGSALFVVAGDDDDDDEEEDERRIVSDENETRNGDAGRNESATVAEDPRDEQILAK